MVDRERVAKAAEALGNYRRTDEEKYFEDLSRCYEALLRKLTRKLCYKILRISSILFVSGTAFPARGGWTSTFCIGGA